MGYDRVQIIWTGIDRTTLTGYNTADAANMTLARLRLTVLDLVSASRNGAYSNKVDMRHIQEVSRNAHLALRLNVILTSCIGKISPTEKHTCV